MRIFDANQRMNANDTNLYLTGVKASAFYLNFNQSRRDPFGINIRNLWDIDMREMM